MTPMGIRSLALLAVLSSLAWADVEAGKVYVGPEGLTVRVVPLKGQPHQVPIQIDGSGTEFDGKAIPHELEGPEERASYRTTVHGRPYLTLFRRDDRVEVSLPGRRDSVRVGYNEEKTKSLVADQVWQRYLKEQKDGSLAAPARFDRKKSESEREAGLGKVVTAFQKACGGAAQMSVDWKSIDDDTLQSLSIASYCGAPLEALERLCKESAAAREQVGKLKQASCTFGAALALDVTDGTLRWTTSRDGANQEEFAREQLIQKLSPAAGKSSPEVPWGAGQSLSELMAIESLSNFAHSSRRARPASSGASFRYGVRGMSERTAQAVTVEWRGRAGIVGCAEDS